MIPIHKAYGVTYLRLSMAGNGMSLLALGGPSCCENYRSIHLTALEPPCPPNLNGLSGDLTMTSLA